MKIQRASSVNETVAKVIFLILPTACVGYFLLWNANRYFTILENNAMEQVVYLLSGMVISCVFYAFRFRFITTSLILFATFLFIYKGLDSTAIGEFDSFFLSVRFLIFAVLFSSGWLTGAAFSRWRYMHYLMSGIVLIASILLIAKQKTDTVAHLFQAFLPAVLYSFYIIFAAEQIYNYQDKSQKFWWFMSRRIVLFVLLASLTGWAVMNRMQKQFETAVTNAGGQGEKGDENGMLKKNKDGNFDLKDYSQLRSNQGRSNELLFAAHIDNFFPGTDMPNPLYLTAFYYTKFDTSTETFERDAQIPKNDLFEPDPSKIPLYSTRSDSSVIKNGMASKGRKTVEIEVYSKKLSPETYLAPNIGFFVQPIAIEKDYRDQFRSAFRAKGYVSELNSAYFIYNAKDPQIRQFQEQRFAVLRDAESYAQTDKAFMDYYTQMPGDAKFQRITALANKVAVNAKTPVDKVLAIRDYFMSKDEEGNPLYAYTDNPGVPDIPSASKLMYFLFENHKGYCAYYAGATLFMLRSLGIPSRITVGFLTIDRSDKNKGWYWYYADQAHAWVQVYFPGYGWLDFDTTVGDDEAQQSPSPDGTPPMQPPHAWFASEGEIVAVDTLRKTIKLRTGQILFHDKEYKVKQGSAEVLLDVSIANIQRDSVNISITQVKPGDSATAVSYAEALKKLPDGKPGESAETILGRITSPLPTDDLYLKKTPQQVKEELLQKQKAEQPFSYRKMFLLIGLNLLIAICLFLSIPLLILTYYRFRSRNAPTPENKAYWQYRGLGFYLHQLGFYRGEQTPLRYAAETIDAKFGTTFTRFMNIFLKTKYTGQKLSAADAGHLASIERQTLLQVKTQLPARKRIGAFLRPLRSFTFFSHKNQT
jgi:hypothetical protein